MDSHSVFREYKNILLDFEDLLSSSFRRPNREPFVPVAPVINLDRESQLKSLEEQVRQCKRCRLSEGRTQAVPGMGVLSPLVMVVGEGPGAEEDKQGLPFVGPAGQFLDKWLDAIGLSRNKNVYIANIVKCRPPGNRDPHPDEAAACLPYLYRQVELLGPKVLFALGRIAIQHLLQTQKGIGELRGKVHQWNRIPLIATYHPSAVLRDPSLKRPVWEDLKQLKALLTELEVSK
ncbi:MAG: uracil-DNA glycosylase [Spirochaetales bacterium]